VAEDQEDAVPVFAYAGERFPIPRLSIVPPLKPEQRENLKQSIADFGIEEPIKLRLKDGSLIDGHNRLLIAAELEVPLDKIPFVFLDVTEEQADNLAVRVNAVRRQMDQPDQVEAAWGLHMRKWSARRIAQALGCSHQTVLRLLAVKFQAGEKGPGTVVSADGVERPAGGTTPTRSEEAARSKRVKDALDQAAAEEAAGDTPPTSEDPAVTAKGQEKDAREQRRQLRQDCLDLCKTLTRKCSQLGVFKELQDNLQYITDKLREVKA
jgi:ParB-like chromosome segregation protein Spo0J